MTVVLIYSHGSKVSNKDLKRNMQGKIEVQVHVRSNLGYALIFHQIVCEAHFTDMRFLCEYELPVVKSAPFLAVGVVCRIPWTYYNTTCILLKRSNRSNQPKQLTGRNVTSVQSELMLDPSMELYNN